MGDLVATAAAGFVGFFRTDEDDGVFVVGGLAVDEALGAAGFATAYHADGVEFVNAFRFGHEDGHGAKGFPAEVHVQARNDDPFMLVGQGVADFDDGVIEELDFVDGDDLGVGFYLGQDVGCVVDDGAFPLGAIVGGDDAGAVAVVDGGFEELDFLAGDHSAAQAA